MKINKIQNNIYYLTKNKKNINKKSNGYTTNKLPDTSQSCKPKYYQPKNNLNFLGNKSYIIAPIYNHENNPESIRIHIPIDTDTAITLNIETHEGGNLFLNEKGYIDEKTAEFFVELYKELYPQRKSEYEKHKATIEKILIENKKNNVVAFNPIADVENSFDSNEDLEGEEWLKAVLNGINDRYQREEMALNYLDMVNCSINECSLIVASEIIAILKLSKTKNGIDTTNIDKKLTIAQKTVNADDGSGKLLDTLIENFKDENGQIDLDTILKMLQEMEIIEIES